MKEQFTEALQGKKIPILTLDNKWYRLLDKDTKAEVAGIEKQLNILLKRQGKLNTETKNIKKLKKKLMTEIVSMVDELGQNESPELAQKIDQNKSLVEECNLRLEEYQDELLELPREIEQLNNQLMLATMECCYAIMQENTDAIEEISQWVTEVRIELKKQLVRKQEMEQKNHDIYSYMHDVFGAEVVNLFDMKYNPEERHPVMPDKRTEKQ